MSDMGRNEATEALVRARRQLQRVEKACWDPPDLVDAVTWAFYAYENAVVAVAESIDEPWSKNHYLKAELDADLVTRGVLTTDVRKTLLELNSLRKDAAYAGEESVADDDDLDPRELVSRLASFVEEVAIVVNRTD